jgi:acetyl-CoA carboxylase carboxyl transferase subunit alpha
VVPEPEAGAHSDPAATGANLKAALVWSMRQLLPLAPEQLLEQRYDRFRKFGAPGRQPVLSPSEEST